MRIVRFAILFSMLALLCFGGTALAKESAPTGRIEGTLRLKEGSNAGVEVTAIETATGQPYFTKTDEKGRFRFSELPEGEVTVFSTGGWYSPVSVTGMVGGGRVWQPELFLQELRPIPLGMGLFSRKPVMNLPDVKVFLNEQLSKTSGRSLGKIREGMSFIAGFQNSEQLKRLASLFELVLNRERAISQADIENKIPQTREFLEKRAEKRAVQEFELLLKAFVWAVEHPAKDAQ